MRKQDLYLYMNFFDYKFQITFVKQDLYNFVFIYEFFDCKISNYFLKIEKMNNKFQITMRKCDKYKFFKYYICL